MTPLNENEPIEVIPILGQTLFVVVIRPWVNEVRAMTIEQVSQFPKKILREWAKRVRPILWRFDPDERRILERLYEASGIEVVRVPIFLSEVIPEYRIDKQPPIPEKLIVSFHPTNEKEVYSECHTVEDFLSMYGHEYILDNYIKSIWICAKEIASKKLKTIVRVFAMKGYVIIMNSGRNTLYLFEIEDSKDVLENPPIFSLSNITYYKTPDNVPKPKESCPYYVMDSNIISRYIKGFIKNKGNISLH